MRRKMLDNLMEWVDSKGRKPMILRGARQTGKTYVVRQLAEKCGRELVELNFERHPEFADAFNSNSPSEIISTLEVILGKDIDEEKAILFLDEIQESAFILSKLRWFYEEMPQLPVIAAGSLLEFALGDYMESMPVGRVTYRYLHPFTFEEFLWALGETKLAKLIFDECPEEFPDAIHNKCLELYRQYCIVGGMPEAVKVWAKSGKMSECVQIQKDLNNSFREDFNKYRKRISAELLRKTLESVAYQTGGTFKYSTVDRGVRQSDIKEAFNMLEKAGLIKRIYHTAANGVPLGAEKNERIFKAIFLDAGLVMAILGLCPLDRNQFEELIWSNKGAMAEQICGQQLLAKHFADEDDMFFWQQTGSGNGEIDYITQAGKDVVPVEIKAGSSGSMKSLHAFMYNKGLKYAERYDTNKPSVQKVSVKTNKGQHVEYTLKSYPLYMI
ncbi:MAG: ATP-binding protein [Parasporobacterium sp.]|nr:ATP-binding protein [Parasporobacterium sp.]